MKRRSVGYLVTRAILWVFLGFMILFTLVPFIMILFTSFKTMPEINDVLHRNLFHRIVPDHFTNFTNYVKVITGTSQLMNGVGFLVFIKNSLIVTLGSLIPAIVFSTMAGYAFAKFKFPFKFVMFFMILAALMVPFQMIAVPLYIAISRVHLVNTYVGIMIPGFITAFGVLLMSEAMATIPDDYLEAARMDGASELWIFTRVATPMAVGSILTLTVIKFLWTWNDYLWPLLVVNSEHLKTVTLGLASFSNALFIVYTDLTAAVVLSMIPIVILYAGTRRYMVNATLASGLKS